MLTCTVKESRLRWLGGGRDSAVDGSKGQALRVEGPSGCDCSMVTHQERSFRIKSVVSLPA